MSFLGQWSSVRSACFARLSPRGVESGQSSAAEETIKPRLGDAAHRFEHYQLVTGEDGKPVELGRGAIGVTYKAFDIDLHCPVTLKVITHHSPQASCTEALNTFSSNLFFALLDHNSPIVFTAPYV